MVVERLFQTLVASVRRESAIREGNLAVAVIDLHDLCFQLVTNLHDSPEVEAVIVRVLVSGDDAVRLIADVQDNLILLHIQYCSRYNFSRVNRLKRLIQHLFKTLL